MINKISFFLFFTALILTIFVVLSFLTIISNSQTQNISIKIFLVLISGFLSYQSIFTLFWMLYAWEDPEKILLDGIPNEYITPKTKFSLLIPARFEEEVIEKTIKCFSLIDYPRNLFEVLILCNQDDITTINAAYYAIRQIDVSNIRVLVYDTFENSKPIALNIGALNAENEVVGVFDAEDQPKKNLLSVINTIYQTENPTAIQGGVQLMNYESNWYSILNALEYYFWFKSALHLFSKVNVIPLGGNTIFFNKKDLLNIGGWKKYLTEDADIGIRLSILNKKIRVFYDPVLATEEEVPLKVSDLLRQRSRWNQGFLQILSNNNLFAFCNIRKSLFAIYLLILPQLTALNFLFILLSFITFNIKLPIFATFVVIFPIYLLILQVLTQLIGYYEFSKDYNKPFTVSNCIKIIITFYPYQIILAYSALRATMRYIFNKNIWEKTSHYNLHRK